MANHNIPWGSTMVNPSVAAPGLGVWIDLEVAKLGLQPNQPFTAHHRFMSTRTHTQGSPFDDNYLYCDDCERYHLGDCSIHGPMQSIRDSQVSVHDPVKSDNSLPAGLIIGRSSIPGAGLGVYAGIDIRKGTVFGPYVGRIVTIDSPEALGSDYCWLVHGEQEPLHCIDGKDLSTSNWMRYVNCANNPEQQNLIAFQYKRYIFYRTFKMISSGSELLVWYGLDCAKQLGLALTPSLPSVAESTASKSDSNNLTCSFCSKTFTRSSLMRKHVNDCHNTPVVSDEFECEFCSLSFPTYGSLHNHVGLSHSDVLASSELECEYCMQSFPSDAALRKHVTTKHKEEAYTQETEEEEVEQLAASSSDESQPNVQSASNVKRGVKRRKSARKRKSNRKKLPPPSLKLSSSTKKKAVKVRPLGEDTAEEPSPISNVYVCKTCQLVFRVYEEYCEHQTMSGHKDDLEDLPNWKKKAASPEVRARLYKCQLCIYVSDFSNNVRLHLLNVHKKVVMYQCQTCQLQIAELRMMQKHLSDSRHEGMVATLIDKKREVTLTDGIENASPSKASVHKDDSAQPVEAPAVLQKQSRNCPICPMIFSQAGGLKRHLNKVHSIISDIEDTAVGTATDRTFSNGTKATGGAQTKKNKRKTKTRKSKPCQRNHQCKVCNMTFKRATHLRRHMAESDPAYAEVATVRKIHECHICAKAFRRSDHLMCHLIKSHKTRMHYVCRHCEGKFGAYFELSAHQVDENHSGVNLKFSLAESLQPAAAVPAKSRWVTTKAAKKTKLKR